MNILLIYPKFRTPRTKTPRQVVAELDVIYQAGWRGNIFFADDNFIGQEVSYG